MVTVMTLAKVERPEPRYFDWIHRCLANFWNGNSIELHATITLRRIDRFLTSRPSIGLFVNSSWIRMSVSPLVSLLYLILSNDLTECDTMYVFSRPDFAPFPEP